MARNSRTTAKKRPAAQHTLPPPKHTMPRAPHADAEALRVEAPRELTVADAFVLLRGQADGVAREQAVEFNADLPLALHNARTGVAAVWPHRERLAHEMAGLPLATMFDCANYVRAAVYAESQALSPRAATRDDIDRRLSSLQEVRVPAILQLQVFERLKMIDAQTVDAIVAGRGTINFAQDGIDLERVYLQHRDAWRAKHPFTDAQIAQLAIDGNWLLDHVLPDGATPRPATPNEFDLLRRQFWALATTAHRGLRSAAMYLWGEENVDARVPRLLSRQVSRGTSAAEPAPTDGTTPAHPASPATP